MKEAFTINKVSDAMNSGFLLQNLIHILWAQDKEGLHKNLQTHPMINSWVETKNKPEDRF